MGGIMQNSISTARDAAVSLITPSIEHGKSFKEIKNSFLDHCSELFSASIGGYVGQRWISSKFVVVKAINGKSISPKVFELYELFNQVRSGIFAGEFSSSNPALAIRSRQSRDYVQQSIF
jgi:hypothetical protein